MDDGWDLHAVVRSCATSAAVSSTAAAVISPADMDPHGDGYYGSGFRSGGLEEIDREDCFDQLLPVNAAGVATSTAVTSISFHDGRSAHDQQPMFGNFISFSRNPVDCDHHARKRKSKNKKRVIEMRKDEMSNDGWAWRKYGQKPIKGSPYPRNYYRCSTTRDCSARKQVERSTADTSSFVVSYSGDHLHPRPTNLSSLAGTTRSTKYRAVATGLPEQPPCSSSSPASTSSFSPATSLKEDETELNEQDVDELIKNY